MSDNFKRRERELYRDYEDIPAREFRRVVRRDVKLETDELIEEGLEDWVRESTPEGCKSILETKDGIITRKIITENILED